MVVRMPTRGRRPLLARQAGGQMLTNKADADKPIIGGKWLSSRFWCGFSGIRPGSDSFAVKYVIFYFNLPVLGCRR